MVATPALALEYYVDADAGDDSAAGTESAPWKTLNTSVQKLGPGDILNIKGTFSEEGAITLDSPTNGVKGASTTIQGWPGEAAIIEIDDIETFVIRADYYSISGIEFHNNGTQVADNSNRIIRIRETNVTGIAIENCVFRDSVAAIYADGNTSEVTIANNTFYNNKEAIDMAIGQDIFIYSNQFYSNTGSRVVWLRDGFDGTWVYNNWFYNHSSTYSPVLVASAPDELFVANNTFYNNYAGIYVMAGTVSVWNNIFANHTDFAVAQLSSVDTRTYDNNLYYNNGAIGYIVSDVYAPSELEMWQLQGHDAHSAVGDPLFSSTAAGSVDLHITKGSPAIDVGKTLSDVEEDIDGDERPINGSYDVGADEFVDNTPDAATNLKAKNVKAKQMKITWDADCDHCTFTLTRSTKSDFSANVKNYSGLSNEKKVVKKLNTSKKYYYKVTVHDGESASDPSSTLSARTLPKKGKVKKVKNTDTDSPVLRCQKIPRISKMKVLVYKKNENGKWKKVKTVNKKKGLTKKVVPVTLSGLEDGVYRAKVRGIYNKNKKGSFSKWKNFTVSTQ